MQSRATNITVTLTATRRRSAIALLTTLTATLQLAAVGCVTEADPSEDSSSTPPDGKADDAAAPTYCEPDTPICIVEGDIPIDQVANLTVMHLDGIDQIWDEAQRVDLSYCVSRTELGDQYERTVTAVAEAAAEWEAVAAIDFIHRPDRDDDCAVGRSDTLFRVRAAPAGARYIARAFFPNYDDSARDLRISFVQLANLERQYPEASLRGIMRHELGHTLGFRHEHIRPENRGGSCREDENFRPLTEYDARSTMHYPWCDGEGDWALELTDRDALGAALVYPNPVIYDGARCPTELDDDGNVSRACGPIAHEILTLANTATLDILTNWVGLDPAIAQTILDHRTTAPFTTLDTLAALPSLAEPGLRRLYDYLYINGRCPSERDDRNLIDTRCRPIVHRILELANHATLLELDWAVGLDRRAAVNIIDNRTPTPYTSIDTLWAIPYVKTQALSKMYDYLYAPD